MPAEHVLLAPGSVDPGRLLDTAIRAMDDAVAVSLEAGGAVQLQIDGRAVLTIVRPRLVEQRSEVARLLPGVAAPAAGPIWWVDVVVAAVADEARAGSLLDALSTAFG